jgi:hypothetical protein
MIYKPLGNFIAEEGMERIGMYPRSYLAMAGKWMRRKGANLLCFLGYTHACNPLINGIAYRLCDEYARWWTAVRAIGKKYHPEHRKKQSVGKEINHEKTFGIY